MKSPPGCRGRFFICYTSVRWEVPDISTIPTACIIGAGSSGLTTAKALQDQGIPFDCFEASDDVGGVWYYQNPNGMSACYKHLHINTSKCRMEWEDFPMPEEWPNYCRHDHIHQYFRAYADHFGLRDRIAFNTRVEHAERTAEGDWAVTISTGETRRYDALFVCNGHHWDPQWPEPAFPGHFDGLQMHAHSYRQPEDFAGKRVVVLGMGNSAMDIAVELSYTAKRVFLSHRRGVHIVPKYLFGRAVDQWVTRGVPPRVGELLLSLMLRIQVGKVEQYGLKRPEHRLMQSHPTISSNILDRIAHGDVTPVDCIAALEGDRVRFSDGRVEEADTIIYCTGYRVTFPFFEEQFLCARDNDLPLYQRMFKPDIPNLMFIGLYQPLGAIFPLAEQQARIGAAYLAGKYTPPPREVMEQRMEAERSAMFRRYIPSRRHTMQVDYDAFLAALKRELKEGQRRARKQPPCIVPAAREDAIAQAR
jgi:dimethylaniline monooxygenase (N-oxide forming)